MEDSELRRNCNPQVFPTPGADCIMLQTLASIYTV